MKGSRVFFLNAVIFFIFLQSNSIAQETIISPAAQKEARLKKAEPRMIYPFIKGATMYSGVLPVNTITNAADYPNAYKLVFDFSVAKTEDLKNGKVSMGIEELIRIINLHKAAGIPENQLNIAVIVHGPATPTFLNNETYIKQFGISNPNLDLIRQLQEKGVVFTVCGQTLQFRELEMPQLVKGMQKSFSARTALSTYQLKGYILFPIEID